MKMMLIFKRGTAKANSAAFPITSLLAYRRPFAFIPIAQKHGVKLEHRYSRTINDRYIMHICPSCSAPQEDYFIVEDLHYGPEELPLVETIKASFCSICKKWTENIKT